jgi:endonuclease/exonuclease/phosphatase family metal-dependent hydrolase
MTLRIFSAVFVLLAAATLAGCMSSAAMRASHAGTLTVVTLNLWHDKQDWPHRQDLIVAELAALQPDVIVLQEVLQDAALPNQAGTLAQRLGYQYRFFSADPPEQTRRYGNAILTRTPVEQARETKLQPLDDYRNAGWVRTTIARKPVNLYASHLHHTPEGGAIRARQIASLQEFMRSTQGEVPAIIAGDFNTPATTPELEPLLRRFADAYADAHPGVDVETAAHTTLNPHLGHPATRIDHVLVQRDAFRVVDARIILDRSDAKGAWPSDHYGVWVKLERRSD